MRKMVVSLLVCLAILAGCTANTPAPPHETPVAVAASPEELRAKGYQAILDVVPSDYLADISVEKIVSAQAILDSTNCVVTVQWETEQTLRDVAALVSSKLNYDLVVGEGDWRNPDGADYPNVRLKEDGSVMVLSYILSPNQYATTLLTESFPLDSFNDLRNDLERENAAKQVIYNKDIDAWEYRLSWALDENQSSQFEGKLKTLFSEQEDFKTETRDGKEVLEFRVSQNESMTIEISQGDKYQVEARYFYLPIPHLSSNLMQRLLDNPQRVLLADLVDEYLAILSNPVGVRMSYRPVENLLTYSMLTEDTGDIQGIAERAEQATGEQLIKNDRGGYQCTGEGFEFTIKVSESHAGWELDIQVADVFTHEYIHEIYPLAYLPELPAVLSTPNVMETACSDNGTGLHIELKRAWMLEDRSQATAAFEAIKTSLSKHRGYNLQSSGDRQVINCMMKEYGFECELSSRDNHYFITLTFRYNEVQGQK